MQSKIDMNGVPAGYVDNVGILDFRERTQRDFCLRRGVRYLVPENQNCPKCKTNVFAFSPLLAPWNRMQVRKCPWCGLDFELQRAVEQAKQYNRR